jgi:hypothetical protein
MLKIFQSFQPTAYPQLVRLFHLIAFPTQACPTPSSMNIISFRVHPAGVDASAQTIIHHPKMRAITVLPSLPFSFIMV